MTRAIQSGSPEDGDAGIRALMFNSLCAAYTAISLCIALKIQCTKNYFTDNSCGESSLSPSSPESHHPMLANLPAPQPLGPFLRPLVGSAGRHIFYRVFLDRASNA